jgi:hypothetical protein
MFEKQSGPTMLQPAPFVERSEEREPREVHLGDKHHVLFHQTIASQYLSMCAAFSVQLSD